MTTKSTISRKKELSYAITDHAKARNHFLSLDSKQLRGVSYGILYNYENKAPTLDLSTKRGCYGSLILSPDVLGYYLLIQKPSFIYGHDIDESSTPINHSKNIDDLNWAAKKWYSYVLCMKRSPWRALLRRKHVFRRDDFTPFGIWLPINDRTNSQFFMNLANALRAPLYNPSTVLFFGEALKKGFSETEAMFLAMQIRMNFGANDKKTTVFHMSSGHFFQNNVAGCVSYDLLSTGHPILSEDSTIRKSRNWTGTSAIWIKKKSYLENAFVEIMRPKLDIVKYTGIFPSAVNKNGKEKPQFPSVEATLDHAWETKELWKVL